MERRRGGRGLAILLLSGLTACATVDTTPAPPLEKGARWALLPAANNTETPQAGARLEAITASLLRARGVRDLVLHPPATDDDLLHPAATPPQAALDWARGQNVRYAVLGSVEEWRYKAGVDGEPAVGLTLTIIDTATGRVLWTGTGARTGWSREAVAAVAQKLAARLVDAALANARG